MNDLREPLSASVVGGGVGGRLSLKALAASDRYRLVAATDLRPDVLAGSGARLRRACAPLPTTGRCSQHCPTDVVCVSTYPPSHEADHARRAWRCRSKAFWSRSRSGIPPRPAAASSRPSGAAGCRWPYPMGCWPRRAPLEIIDRVQGGEIGELALVEIQCTGWDIINAGIHWLDFVVTVLGNEPVVSVMAQCDSSTRTYRDGMQVETVAVTSVQTESGVRVVMHTGDHVEISRPARRDAVPTRRHRGADRILGLGEWLSHRECEPPDRRHDRARRVPRHSATSGTSNIWPNMIGYGASRLPHSGGLTPGARGVRRRLSVEPASVPGDVPAREFHAPSAHGLGSGPAV